MFFSPLTISNCISAFLNEPCTKWTDFTCVFYSILFWTRKGCVGGEGRCKMHSQTEVWLPSSVICCNSEGRRKGVGDNLVWNCRAWRRDKTTARKKYPPHQCIHHIMNSFATKALVCGQTIQSSLFSPSKMEKLWSNFKSKSFMRRHVPAVKVVKQQEWFIQGRNSPTLWKQSRHSYVHSFLKGWSRLHTARQMVLQAPEFPFKPSDYMERKCLSFKPRSNS